MPEEGCRYVQEQWSMGDYPELMAELRTDFWVKDVDGKTQWDNLYARVQDLGEKVQYVADRLDKWRRGENSDIPGGPGLPIEEYIYQHITSWIQEHMDYSEMPGHSDDHLGWVWSIGERIKRVGANNWVRQNWSTFNMLIFVINAMIIMRKRWSANAKTEEGEERTWVEDDSKDYGIAKGIWKGIHIQNNVDGMVFEAVEVPQPELGDDDGISLLEHEENFTEDSWLDSWFWSVKVRVLCRDVNLMNLILKVFNLTENLNMDTLLSGAKDINGGDQEAGNLTRIFGFKSIQNGVPVDANDEWLTERLRILLPIWMSNLKQGWQ